MTMRSYDDVDFRPWYLPDTARWLKLEGGMNVWDPNETGVWDVAYDDATAALQDDCDDDRITDRHDRRNIFANGAEWGAGWAFAIVGMFTACDDPLDAARAAILIAREALK